MNKTRKNKKPITKNKKPIIKKKKIIIKGGFAENYGFPKCTNLSQFVMTPNNIINFTRDFSSPMDCFINALQMFGVLDPYSANLMRISTIGTNGFTKEQIEWSFMYRYNHNFNFERFPDFQSFSNIIVNSLQPNYAVFAGIYRHVFIIAKDQNNDIFYIDPQIKTPICPLNQKDCIDKIKNTSEWYLLYNSMLNLTETQQKILIKTINDKQSGKYSFF